MSKDIASKLKKIKVLIMDVDGVLTRGDIVLDDRGHELKFFNVHDGLGIVLFQKAGFKTAVISARAAGAVHARCKDLKIGRVFQNAHPKTKAYQQVLKAFAVKDEQVCFIGDDLPDLCILKRAGLAISVPNGTAEAKKAAHYITKKFGGDGAVREVIELILKAQNKWKPILEALS